MLNGETIAVCSEIHTKHINVLCGQNGGVYEHLTLVMQEINHRALF